MPQPKHLTVPSFWSGGVMSERVLKKVYTDSSELEIFYRDFQDVVAIVCQKSLIEYLSLKNSIVGDGRSTDSHSMFSARFRPASLSGSQKNYTDALLVEDSRFRSDDSVFMLYETASDRGLIGETLVIQPSMPSSPILQVPWR